MREVDRWAIEEQGTPSLLLMERAGEAVARALERLCPDGPVAVLCGKGNNGGDGLVVARLLRERGRQVTVLSVAGPGSLGGDAGENLRKLPGQPPIALLASPAFHSPALASPALASPAPDSPTDSPDPVGEPSLLAASRAALSPAGRAALAALRDAAAIVDALLGTGFRGSPEGAVLAAIEAIGRVDAPILSVDVPSGVDASSGAVPGAAVAATVTVTFHAGKPGLWIAPGKQHAGAVEVLDIGIPRGAPAGAEVGLITQDVLAILPRRTAGGTKFTSGRVVVAGGSAGLTGAPRMSGEAAMRAGAGYVTVCLPAAAQPIFAAGPRPELMSRAMPESDGSLTRAAVAPVKELADGAGALALGPGLGRDEQAVGFARELARSSQAPLVLDADGLNAHAGLLETLAGRRASTVLTPHSGELGRLLGLDSAEIQEHRLEHVRDAARRANAVVLLKGDDTLVAEPGGVVAVSPGGSPALATAGTGDVLTGVIAALLAQGLSAFDAAAAGAYLHAVAGRIAARRQGCAEAVIASDVIDALGRARGEGTA